MKKILFLFLCATLLSCSRELSLTPPAGAQVLAFEKNVHAKNRAIYQTNADGEFRNGESTHVFWGGIVTPEVSHRLHANLMSNIPEIYFVLSFPKTGKKVYCTAGKGKESLGCNIPSQEMKENEFIIEVFGPKCLKIEKNPEYRLFVGLEGAKEIKFYRPGK